MRFFDRAKTLLANEYFKTCVEGFVALATILATVVALVAVTVARDTLSEMQVERDRAYQPFIVFEDKQVDITWGDQEELEGKNPMANPDMQENLFAINIKAFNIGVGVAKNINISFPMDTLDKWILLLQRERPEKDYSYIIDGGILYVTLDGKWSGYTRHIPTKKLYLLPNAEESFDVFLPLEYSQVIRKVFEEFQIGRDDLVPIEAIVRYEDIQGKKYSQEVSFDVRTLFLTSDGEGNGYASYGIIMTQQNNP